MKRLILVFGALLMASESCLAGDNTHNSAMVNSGNPAYISGGIGSDDPIEFVKEDYNLHLVFAAKGSGEYLADVNITIQNASGNRILETLSPGPLFYVTLPPGNYQIKAEFLGKQLSRSVSIEKARSRTLHFYWDSAGM